MSKGINILSLFDGISCGRIALERVGIKVDNYYSSEIDKYAIQIADKNYPQDSDKRLGDVTKWLDWNIDWSSIDLVTGGFPCQAWSVAGKQLGDKDERGMLFWTMLDIMKKVLERNPKAKFLIENVKMKKEFEEYITLHTTQALGVVHKHLIDSALVSAQNRQRYYWTNIEGIEQPEDRSIFIKDILESEGVFEYISESKLNNITYRKNYLQYDIYGKGNNSQNQRAFYISSKCGTLTTCGSMFKINLPNNKVRKFTIKELERLQTLPEDYTSGVNKSKGSFAIGNGWTVDVIAHILRYANFKTKGEK